MVAQSSVNVEFATPQELCARFSWLKMGGLRKWAFDDTAGFRSKCVRMVGRKMLISVPDFIAWVDSQRDPGRKSA